MYEQGSRLTWYVLTSPQKPVEQLGAFPCCKNKGTEWPGASSCCLWKGLNHEGSLVKQFKDSIRLLGTFLNRLQRDSSIFQRCGFTYPGMKGAIPLAILVRVSFKRLVCMEYRFAGASRSLFLAQTSMTKPQEGWLCPEPVWSGFPVHGWVSGLVAWKRDWRLSCTEVEDEFLDRGPPRKKETGFKLKGRKVGADRKPVNLRGRCLCCCGGTGFC